MFREENITGLETFWQAPFNQQMDHPRPPTPLNLIVKILFSLYQRGAITS